MPNFGQSVGLIHKLRKLTSAEEFFHGSDNRPYVDESIGSVLAWFLNALALFNNPLHTQQSNAKLRLDEFTNTTYATIAEVIDIIFTSMAIIQLNQATHDVDQVILR